MDSRLLQVWIGGRREQYAKLKLGLGWLSTGLPSDDYWELQNAECWLS